MQHLQLINDKVDYTYLKPYGTCKDVVDFLYKALDYKPYAVCVFPQWVPLANDVLKDTDIKIVTVIGFPFGKCAFALMIEANSSIVLPPVTTIS